MSEQQGARAALEDYLSVVRQFYKRLIEGTKPETLLALYEEPRSAEKSQPLALRLDRAERAWLDRLLQCFEGLEHGMANFERWREWYFALTRGLKLTEEDLRFMLKGPEVVLGKLREKALDKGYARLVVDTAASDFADILTETRPILDCLLALRPFAQKLESPWIDRMYTRLDRVIAVKFPELLGQVQQLLAAAYNASTHEDFLRNLAALTHIFGGWQNVLGLYEGPQADSQQVVKGIRKTRDEVSRLATLTRQLKDFVETRNTCYYYMRQAELSVIRMMLTDEGSSEQWWRMFLEEPIENILGSLPQKIDPHQLLIGVSHSLALLEDLQHRLLPKMPIQTTIVDEIVDFLKSPALALYADAQRFRLSVWAEFYQKWLAQLTRLGDALQRGIEQSEATARQDV
jgi:hypothetical protein